MDMIRTFIAIQLPTKTRQALQSLQSHLKPTFNRHAVRWTPLENIHLTLHFLGNIPPSQVEPISQAMAEAAQSTAPFTLSLSELGCFPNTHRPQVIWVGVGHQAALTELHQTLAARLQAAIDFQVSGRSYKPHLTLGRVKREQTPTVLRQLGQQVAQQRIGQVATLPVNIIHLIKSELQPTGSVYTPLATATLGIDD